MIRVAVDTQECPGGSPIKHSVTPALESPPCPQRVNRVVSSERLHVVSSSGGGQSPDLQVALSKCQVKLILTGSRGLLGGITWLCS